MINPLSSTDALVTYL